MSTNLTELEFVSEGHKIYVRGPRKAGFLQHPHFQFKKLIYKRTKHCAKFEQESFEDHFSARPTAGLLPACEILAKSMGIEPSVRSACLAPIGRPQPFTLPPTQKCEARDPALVRFFAHHERGIVRHGPLVDVAWCVAQIALSFPRAKLAVVLASREMAKEMTACLTGFIGPHRMAECWLNNAELLDLRIAVGIVGDFAYDRHDIERRDLLIFPNAAEALHVNAQDLFIAPESRCRVFAFLSSKSNRSWTEWQYLRGVFGFDEIAIPAHGIQKMNVLSSWREFRSPTGFDSTDARQFLRTNVWRNSARNRFVASIARESRLGFGQFDLSLRHRTRTIVATDSLAHALALRKHLPDWPIVTARYSNLNGLTKGERDAIVRQSAMWDLFGDRLIVTGEGLYSLPGTPNGVVIWASSGAHGVEFPHSQRTFQQLESPASPEPNLMLVDIADRNSQALRRWVRFRRENYVQEEFLPFGAPAGYGRAYNFLTRMIWGRT